MTTSQTDIAVPLPSLGESIEEATVTRWLKQPGDSVAFDEPLLEVSTDKVDTEIASPCSGLLLSIAVEENDVVGVGATLAIIRSASNGSKAAETLLLPVSSAPEAQPAPAGAPPQEPELPLSPPAPAIQTAPSRPASTAVDQSLTEKLSPIRRTIARRMCESLQTSAQLTTVVEVDLNAVSRLRAEHKDEFHQRTGVKLSFLPFFVKATLEALPHHRVLNAALNADVSEVTYHRHCHLGIAVEGPKGLTVPVIRNADTLSITGIAHAIATMAAKVRNGAVTVDELNGGTFTITNTGSRGALFDTPIINQPQTGILGTGAVVERVVAVRDPDSVVRIEVRPMAYLSISYDHRIVDGADAAGFLSHIKDRLEQGFTAADVVS